MPELSDLRSLLIYAAVIAVVLTGMLGLSALVGTRRTGAQMGRSMTMPFESGIVPVGSAHLRLPIHFYLVAMFFVIFDVEAVFLFAWALVVREAGWIGYGAVLVFVAYLLAALLYLWRAGALSWGPRERQVKRTLRGAEGKA